MDYYDFIPNFMFVILISQFSQFPFLAVGGVIFCLFCHFFISCGFCCHSLISTVSYFSFSDVSPNDNFSVVTVFAINWFLRSLYSIVLVKICYSVAVFIIYFCVLFCNFLIYLFDCFFFLLLPIRYSVADVYDFSVVTYFSIRWFCLFISVFW